MRIDFRRYLAGLFVYGLFFIVLFSAVEAFGWWNQDWQYRRKIAFDTSPAGADVKENISEIPVLVRLHLGNFNFGNAKEGGEDLRFVAADDQTMLKYHIEKYDTIDEIAAVWVKLPKLSGGVGEEFIWMYYGNDAAVGGQGARETYDASQIGVYHFGELEGMPQDSSMNGNHAAVFLGGLGLPGVVGNCAVFSGGSDKMIIDNAPSLNFSNGFTFCAWVRIAQPQTDSYLFARSDEDKEIVVGIDDTKVYARVTQAGGGVSKTDRSADLSLGAWHHVAITGAPDEKVAVYIDGLELSWAPFGGSIPDLAGAFTVGADASGNHAFFGEIDEVRIAGVQRSPGYLRASYTSQGPEGTLYQVGAEEISDGGGGGMPVFYLASVVKNITLDGWIVIGSLVLLSIASWYVFFMKAVSYYLIEKENKGFLDAYVQQQEISALSCNDNRFPNSNIFKVYKEGCQKLDSSLCYVNGMEDDDAEPETRAPADKGGKLGNRAINAVKSILEKGYMEQTQQLNAWMVVLTLAISGGPFLGLLGTVWGVMNTFAALAETGEANLAAIAPGIASALTTTIVGLLVAIPALFAYNYLVGKMKNITMELTVFIDQFGVRVDEMHGD